MISIVNEGETIDIRDDQYEYHNEYDNDDDGNNNNNVVVGIDGSDGTDRVVGNRVDAGYGEDEDEDDYTSEYANDDFDIEIDKVIQIVLDNNTLQHNPKDIEEYSDEENEKDGDDYNNNDEGNVAVAMNDSINIVVEGVKSYDEKGDSSSNSNSIVGDSERKMITIVNEGETIDIRDDQYEYYNEYDNDDVGVVSIDDDNNDVVGRINVNGDNDGHRDSRSYIDEYDKYEPVSYQQREEEEVIITVVHNSKQYVEHNCDNNIEIVVLNNDNNNYKFNENDDDDDYGNDDYYEDEDFSISNDVGENDKIDYSNSSNSSSKQQKIETEKNTLIFVTKHNDNNDSQVNKEVEMGKEKAEEEEDCIDYDNEFYDDNYDGDGDGNKNNNDQKDDQKMKGNNKNIDSLYIDTNITTVSSSPSVVINNYDNNKNNNDNNNKDYTDDDYYDNDYDEDIDDKDTKADVNDQRLMININTNNSIYIQSPESAIDSNAPTVSRNIPTSTMLDYNSDKLQLQHKFSNDMLDYNGYDDFELDDDMFADLDN